MYFGIVSPDSICYTPPLLYLIEFKLTLTLFVLETAGAKEIGCAEQTHQRRLFFFDPTGSCGCDFNNCYLGID